MVTCYYSNGVVLVDLTCVNAFISYVHCMGLNKLIVVMSKRRFGMPEVKMDKLGRQE